MNLKDGGSAECVVSAERVEINDQQCIIWALQDVSERRRSEDELIEAIETVMADTSWFSRTVVERLAGLRQTSKGTAPTASLSDLTEREEDILTLICEGCSDKDMSDRLNLSKHTRSATTSPRFTERSASIVGRQPSSGRASVGSADANCVKAEIFADFIEERPVCTSSISSFLSAIGAFKALSFHHAANDGDINDEKEGVLEMDNNRIEGAVRQAKGSIKEAVGKITGNVGMQAEGRAEKVAGEVQSKYGQSKDAVKKSFK